MADTTFINRVIEPHVRLWLGSQLPGHSFAERAVPVSGGSFKFDAVSGDGSIVGLILSSRPRTATGNENYGGWRKALNDIQWLKAASASRRLVVCTNEGFRSLVMRRSKRLGTDGIDFMYCQLPDELERQLNARLDASSREQRTRAQRAGEATREDGDGQGGESLNERSILEIAADHLEKDGYVVYEDFSELKPVNETGNRYLFRVKHCLLEHGHPVHERRHRAEWSNCGYPGESTHFHRSLGAEEAN